MNTLENELHDYAAWLDTAIDQRLAQRTSIDGAPMLHAATTPISLRTTPRRPGHRRALAVGVGLAGAAAVFGAVVLHGTSSSPSTIVDAPSAESGSDGSGLPTISSAVADPSSTVSTPTTAADTVASDQPTTSPAESTPATDPVTTSTAGVDTTPMIEDTLQVGSTGDDVTLLQKRLYDLHFLAGDPTGTFDTTTEQAVWAFQKLVLGVAPGPGVTGVVTPQVWAEILSPVTIAPRRTGEGTHVEIYVPQQVLAVFTDDQPVLIAHISTGSEQQWCETVHIDTADDGTPIDPPTDRAVCGVSRTPGGVFRISRMLTGHRVGALGGLDNPIYFNYGIAIAGSKDLPLTPSSHGCVRVSESSSNEIAGLVHVNDGVFVWGSDGREPEQYTRQDSLPTFNYADPNATTTTVAA